MKSRLNFPQKTGFNVSNLTFLENQKYVHRTDAPARKTLNANCKTRRGRRWTGVKILPFPPFFGWRGHKKYFQVSFADLPKTVMLASNTLPLTSQWHLNVMSLRLRFKYTECSHTSVMPQRRISSNSDFRIHFNAKSQAKAASPSLCLSH